MTDKLGTDKLEKVLKIGCDIVVEYNKAKEDDGKVSTMEMVGFADEAIALVTLIPQGKTILAQFKDVDSEEGAALVNYVVSRGILNEKAQVVVINVVAAVEKLYDVYVTNITPIIEAFKKE